MTTMEIAKRYNLLPKDVTAYIQANATFPVKKNFQTGEISIPDNIDVDAFIAPLLNKTHGEQLEREKREAEKIAEERKRQAERRFLQEENEKKRAEQLHAAAVEKLKKEGAEGYYQYKIVSLVDENGGYVDTNQLLTNLNALGIEGWRLVAAYTNELGHNTNPGVFGSTNATVDQNVLIFEKFVKF